MIRTKADLKYYIERDRVANNLEKPGLLNSIKRLVAPQYIWRYIVTLRKCEYYKNGGGCMYFYYKIRLNKLGAKLGICIPCNVFGPGLSIPHSGLIVVNTNARVGENCRIMQGVTIGSTSGSSKAPIIGNNVFLGPNSVVLGDVIVADNVSIGANATVIKNCDQTNGVYAGTPAALKKKDGTVWWKFNGLDL